MTPAEVARGATRCSAVCRRWAAGCRDRASPSAVATAAPSSSPCWAAVARGIASAIPSETRLSAGRAGLARLQIRNAIQRRGRGLRRRSVRRSRLDVPGTGSCASQTAACFTPVRASVCSRRLQGAAQAACGCKDLRGRARPAERAPVPRRDPKAETFAQIARGNHPVATRAMRRRTPVEASVARQIVPLEHADDCTLAALRRGRSVTALNCICDPLSLVAALAPSSRLSHARWWFNVTADCPGLLTPAVAVVML